MTVSSALADPLILAYGDSLIAGYGLAGIDAFPAQLARRLRTIWPAADVLNAGVSGNTSEDVLRRLPRTLAGFARRPDLAVLQIGANDVLRGIAPQRLRANLDMMLDELGRCGIAVLLTTIEPPAFLADRTRGYAEVHAGCARAHGAATCAFFPAGVLGHPDLTLIDRIHPNARGIVRVVDHVLPAVEAALRAATRAAA